MRTSYNARLSLSSKTSSQNLLPVQVRQSCLSHKLWHEKAARGELVIAKKKVKGGDGVYLLGQSANTVTGSLYLVKFGDKRIVLDAGLYQSANNSYLDNYKVNSRKIESDVIKADYLLISHPHIDHVGLVPRLYKLGFRGRVISTKETKIFARDLLLNSAGILAGEARLLSKKYSRNYEPIYTEADVNNSLELFETYNNYNETVSLDDTVSIFMLPNSHCLGAVQYLITLKDERKTRRILFTGDIGRLHDNANHYVSKSGILDRRVDLVLSEATYGLGDRDTKRKRQQDIGILKQYIQSTVERGGSVVMPVFAFSRSSEVLTELYLAFKDDENFKTPVIVDGVLSAQMFRDYEKVLDGEDLCLWQDVLSWKNLRIIEDKKESDRQVASAEQAIILSSSGFMTNGRILQYAAKYLPDEKSTFVFTGWAGSNPTYLSYKIKNAKKYDSIKIAGRQVRCRADCVSLQTFSCHMDAKSLQEYLGGKYFDATKICLVHGDEDAKIALKARLQCELSKNNKSTRVVIGALGSVLRL